MQLRKLLVYNCLLGICANQSALEALDRFPQPEAHRVGEETRASVSTAAEIMRTQRCSHAEPCSPPHLFVAHALSLPYAHVIRSDGR